MPNIENFSHNYGLYNHFLEFSGGGAEILVGVLNTNVEKVGGAEHPLAPPGCPPLT